MEISMDLMGHNGYHHYQMDVNGRIKSIDGLFISLSLYHYHYNPLDIICEWEIKHKTYIYLRWCLKIHRFTDSPRRYDESLFVQQVKGGSDLQEISPV